MINSLNIVGWEVIVKRMKKGVDRSCFRQLGILDLDFTNLSGAVQNQGIE